MPKAPLRVFPTPEAIADHLAPLILEQIERARIAGKRYLLGCPTGRTAKPIYAAIARLLEQNPQDLSHLVIVMMDEYLVADGPRFTYASADNPWTCRHFARVLIAEAWNKVLQAGQRLREDSIWFPIPSDPESYDAKIAAGDGIDFFILASGASDGHVGFNPPGSPRESKTRVVQLSQETRRDNLSTFPEFGALEKVPTHGVTVGIDTIASAKAKVMVVTGEGKRFTLNRIKAGDRYQPEWPATVIHEGSAGEIIADRAASPA
jgi:glucosamine-6-phosphate deaminase